MMSKPPSALGAKNYLYEGTRELHAFAFGGLALTAEDLFDDGANRSAPSRQSTFEQGATRGGARVKS